MIDGFTVLDVDDGAADGSLLRAWVKSEDSNFAGFQGTIGVDWFWHPNRLFVHFVGGQSVGEMMLKSVAGSADA